MSGDPQAAAKLAKRKDALLRSALHPAGNDNERLNALNTLFKMIDLETVTVNQPFLPLAAHDRLPDSYDEYLQKLLDAEKEAFEQSREITFLKGQIMRLERGIEELRGTKNQSVKLKRDLKKANERIVTLEARIHFLDQRCDELLEKEYRQSVEIARLKEARRFKPRNVTEYVRQTSYTVAEAKAEKARIEKAFADGLIKDEPRRKFKRQVSIRVIGYEPKRKK